MMEDKEEEENIILSDYVKYGVDAILRTDAYFCTRMGEVKGYISFHQKYLQFDAIECQENTFIVPYAQLTPIERQLGKLLSIL